MRAAGSPVSHPSSAIRHPPFANRPAAEATTAGPMAPRESSPMSDANAPKSKTDEALDAALDAATKMTPARPTQEVPLKRQWDDEMEAELEAALAGFDASTFDVASPRTRAADRQHVPKEGRGQE